MTKLNEWLESRDDWLQLFNSVELEEALKEIGYTVKDLTDELDFEHGEPLHCKPRKLVEGYHSALVTRTMSRNGLLWEAREQARVQTWRVKARYQGLKHEKIVRALLNKKFNWFKGFKWSIYEFRGADYEIYLTTEKGSLYVPVKALLKRDIHTIRQRNIDYLTFYGRCGPFDLNKKEGETLEQYKARQEATIKKSLKVLKADTTIKLFDKITR